MSKKNIGWREWVSLPELDIPHLKAKIDTGARTSALHAFELETFYDNEQLMVRFGLHPQQKNNDLVKYCIAPVIDERNVTDSGGHQEKRLVIETSVSMGDETWPIELTLTNRDTMKFRMLLGRTGMKKKFLVDPDASFLMGKPDKPYRTRTKGQG